MRPQPKQIEDMYVAANWLCRLAAIRALEKFDKNKLKEGFFPISGKIEFSESNIISVEIITIGPHGIHGDKFSESVSPQQMKLSDEVFTAYLIPIKEYQNREVEAQKEKMKTMRRKQYEALKKEFEPSATDVNAEQP